MSNFELQSKYYDVLINEVLDIRHFSIDNIKKWYNSCKQYIIGSWFNDLDIPTTIDVDKEFDNIYGIIEHGLRDQTYKMFKNMYEGERMLGMLKEYTYTSRDIHTIDMIKSELNQTCNWLIELCIYCVKYHLLRALDEDVQDVIAEYGPEYGDKILQSAYIKMQKVDNLDLSYCKKYLIGYDTAILEFIELYNTKQFNKLSLNQKLTKINQFKDIAHFNGTLIQGTDPFYIFDEDHKDMYDSITQLNNREIERKLKRIVGY